MATQKLFIFFLLIGTINFPSFAQDHVYVFNHLTSENGLTSGQYNYYIFKDSKGLVWISSVMGLNRFDGKTIKQFHTAIGNPKALVSEFASNSMFYEDHKNNIWFTNNECLTRYSHSCENFDHYWFVGPNKDTIRNYYFWAQLIEENGDLFVSGGRHLFAINVNNPNEQIYVDSLYVTLKDKMFYTDKGDYYLMSCGYDQPKIDLRIYDGQKKLKQPPRTFFTTDPKFRVNDMLYISDSLTWVATSGGLFKLNLVTGRWKAMPAKFDHNLLGSIVQIEKWEDSRLVIGTLDQGIYFFDPKEERYYAQIKAYDGDLIKPFRLTIDRLYLDEDSNLWISAKDDGVYFCNLQKPKIGMLLAGEGRGVNSTISITQASDQSIWLLLPRKAIQIKGRDTIAFQLPITGVDLEQPTFIKEDQQNRIWIGTLKDLYMLVPGHDQFQAVNLLPDGFQDMEVGYNDLHQLSNGTLIFGTNAMYMMKVNKNLSKSNWINKHITRSRSFLSGPDSTFLLHTYQDSLFAGILTKEGIYQLDTVFSNLPFVSSMIKDSIRNLYWIGTFHGLFKLSVSIERQWQLERVKGLDPDLIIKSMLLGKEGVLWMAVSGKLMAYLVDSNRVQTFNKFDGVQGLDFNVGAAYFDSFGRIFFGGTNGINVFQDDIRKSNIPKAKPLITNILLNQEENLASFYSPADFSNPMLIQKLKLPYDTNNISLTLSALEYSAPEACAFKYQLVGSTDESIVYHGTNPNLDFPSLSPGNYILRIWASNSDGIWSEKAHELEIEVMPPWYKSWWFYILTLVSFAIAFYLIYRYRINELLQRQQLEQKALDLKRLAAETETAVLRLQMNPHFIFNSLNSIDAYIIKGEKAKAHNYIVQFSELMRGILNNSEQMMTNLEDELYLLDKYLATEQMRIGPRMQYSFQVDPDIDTYEAEIPTMILQPFVENAIWHGISPKQGAGHISIHFLKKAQTLICEVTDNGIGRQQIEVPKKYESKSTQITSRRLALITQTSSHMPPRFEIEDLINEEGEPAGTTVRFFFSEQT